MASSTVTRSAASKLTRPRGARWTDGPVCRPDELKQWEIELADFLELVAIVERAAPSTKDAVQWLRRMFYSTPLRRAGKRFDTFIATDAARLSFPLTTADVPQAVLDALARVSDVRIPGAAAPLDLVEISHVFVLLDLTLNGLSSKGATADLGLRAGGASVAFLLSWLGDVGSAWLGYQKPMEAAKAAAGATWAEPVATAADLATPLAWLEGGIRERAPIDDLLGDIDAFVLAREPLPASPTPIATLLSDYYTVGVHSATAARVDDRFANWATRLDPEIPHSTGAAGVTLDPTARDWLHDEIWTGVAALLSVDRAGTSPTAIALAAPGLVSELGRPWNSKMIDGLADRFHSLLLHGLAGTSFSWPTQPPPRVEYSGYDWAPAPPVLPTAAGPDDLAGVAQFHLNWRQPHRDLRLTDRLLRPLLLRDPAGPKAAVVPGGAAGTTALQVDEFVGLRDVLPAPTGEHADLLRLSGDTARASKTYRIVAADPATRTLTVDGTPAIGASSAWQVIRRPRLVVVDPFAGRMAGAAASTLTAPAGWIDLDGAPDLGRIRANFDMVLLYDDLHRPSHAYRVLAVDPAAARVRLDDSPILVGSSGWQLPAGVAWTVNPLATALTPTAAGCDAYDGLLFVVYDGAVQGQPVPISTYSSAVNAGDAVLGSSITGNSRYAVRSLRSPTSDARNYELAVTDPGSEAADLVAQAGYYQDGVTALGQPAPPTPTARPDPDGKVNIRIHIGNTAGSVSGSTGDLVAPDYPELRAQLVALHQAERDMLGLPADPDLAAVAAATTQSASVALYNAGTVGEPQWNDRLHYELILVRPDLRPTIP
jgi:hypothetical protein